MSSTRLSHRGTMTHNSNDKSADGGVAHDLCEVEAPSDKQCSRSATINIDTRRAILPLVPGVIRLLVINKHRLRTMLEISISLCEFLPRCITVDRFSTLISPAMDRARGNNVSSSVPIGDTFEGRISITMTPRFNNFSVIFSDFNFSL